LEVRDDKHWPVVLSAPAVHAVKQRCLASCNCCFKVPRLLQLLFQTAAKFAAACRRAPRQARPDNPLFVCCAVQDLSAHVMYRLTRARLTANLLAFSVDDASNAKFKGELKEELELLREEYRCWPVGCQCIACQHNVLLISC
jgi:hypothetical protein